MTSRRDLHRCSSEASRWIGVDDPQQVRVDAAQQVNASRVQRGGNRALKNRTIMLQIIEEIDDIITPKDKDESRAQLSAAYIRLGQAQRDHANVAEAHRALELARQGNVVRFPGAAVAGSKRSGTAIPLPSTMSSPPSMRGSTYPPGSQWPESPASARVA